MENSTDSYLHKKFKKQLSVEPKGHNEKKGVVDAREEKTECNRADNQTHRDNNESVPNQSTNQNSSLLSRNFSKSSISVEECRTNLQSSNSCISFVEKSWNEQSKPSFDTNEPVNASSILDNLYSKQNYVKPEDVSSNIAKDHEETDRNEPQTTPDKSAAGKYVCPYCNLVCSKPSVLQKHIRAHTNERPYPCNSCGFSFKTRSNLYKHCRSRTHANRVMGNKVQELNNELPDIPEPRSPQSNDTINEDREKMQDLKTKPYKPRFHTKQFFKENEENKDEPNKQLSDHINDIINKNNSIVNSNDSYLLKKRPTEAFADNNEHVQRSITDIICLNNVDEPLNLTKNRKRCMSEVVEPVAQKSLIKELLLKNLSSDNQCPHCKMIFQTVTELELHKLRSCKGFVKPGAKYVRSSSVNVASILTQNKNAFDNIPHLQNTIFPLKSPGPFLGKTRLVESDKSKSFSFDDGLPTAFNPSDRYLLSPLTLPSEKEKKTPVKLFGGEVKITHTSGETKSFKIDNKDDSEGYVEYSGKVSENRVVKSGLQSGGTILTNKANYTKDDVLRGGQDVIRVYDNTPVSPSIDISSLGKPQINFNRQGDIYRPSDVIVRTQVDQFSSSSPSYKYTNIVDFSQKALKLLTPNLKQPNLAVPGIPAPNRFTFPSLNEEKVIDLERPKLQTESEPQNLTTQKVFQPKVITSQPNNLYNPMKLLVNGKVVRYVPGIPGPVAAEEPMDMAYAGGSPIVSTRPVPRPLPKPEPKAVPPPQSPKMETLEVKTDFPAKISEMKSPKPAEKSPVKMSEPKKFARPNSLALKPTAASLKQHHGLTPTMFNQILISPDTPRVAKKYVQQYLHGNYFSYLGLKCSTKPVYCTLNKTQPFYVPHFKKLSMYSEWRQQDTKAEKLFVSGYDSRQRHSRYSTAGTTSADLVVHSSYKFVVSESPSGDRGDDQQKSGQILGGYECNDDYTYIRGRGRGRYVCDQCGIRCKKPSMLKKHIRTHSNDRPYTCNHCNFSFKTKGNLTKHMKSKAHTKNYAASGSGSSTQQSGTQSSDSDTDDSGMDSSDESTRREEHEAAYGLLSLSQKTSQNRHHESASPISSAGDPPPHNVLNTEEIAHVSKANYVKNKFLDDKPPMNFSAPDLTPTPTTSTDEEAQNLLQFLGKTTINRPLTYPYTSILYPETHEKEAEKAEPKSIKQFHVIQKYAAHPPSPNKVRESPKLVDSGANCYQEKVTSAPKVRTSELTNAKVNNAPPPVLKVNDSVVLGDGNVADLRKRKLGYAEDEYDRGVKQHKSDEVMDLSMPTEKHPEVRYNGSPREEYPVIKKNEEMFGQKERSPVRNNGYVVLAPIASDVNINYVIQEGQPSNGESPKSYKSVEYDNSAMETLADIATKQVKLEKNTLAKSVASEFLKIATKNESGDVGRDAGAFGRVSQEVNDLIVRPEGNKSCHICAKSFSKAPQLRLHMNIHYLERPFRCHSCSVSFRTKGHLQKHERSASHHNKLSSSPALSSSEPRPFKCVDCNIAFRIHGHLAKHLRSKMHIMKLECLAKIPFGLYAELERSNSLLTEINTADGDQCLESLKTLAKKVFINDPNKLNQLNPVENAEADS